MEPAAEEGGQGHRFGDNRTGRKLDEIKSQKNLNSLAFLEDNADEPKDNEGEERRQTEIENFEMRQTYTKPRMPKRLPWQEKTRPVIKEATEKPIKLMIENNQYRQTQEVLPPLAMEEKEKKDSKNPFLVVNKFNRIIAEINARNERNKSDLHENMKSYMATMSHKFMLDEFLMLEYIKSAQNTGPIKKILHLPTFQLYAAKQEPTNSRPTLASLKGWISTWENKIAIDDDSAFVKILNVDWKRPKGYITIITEYFPKGSLQNLLDSVGSLPQNAIQEVCLPVLRALTRLYSITEGGYGSLSPSQILFTHNLEIKLGLGLAGRGNTPSTSNIYNTKISINKPKQAYENQNPSILSKQPYKNNLLDRSLDVLKFGLISLRCSVGSFEMFQQSATIFENVQSLVTEQGQEIVERENLCCIIHSEEYLTNMHNDEKQTKRERLEGGRLFHFLTFLRSRYSSPFINFLCISLQLSNKKRATVPDLLSHSFIKSKFDPSLVKVTLEDLHKITKPRAKVSSSINNRKVNKFVQSIESSIRMWKRELLPDFRFIGRDRVQELAEELGISEDTLQQKINVFIQNYPS